jgi:hypothetical protein
MSIGTFGTIQQIVVAVAISLLMYAAFRPYTESLLIRIALGILSFGFLTAIFRTAVRGEPASAILLNFVAASVWIAVAFAIIHTIDKWLLARPTRPTS